jgi:hypothetical protein
MNKKIKQSEIIWWQIFCVLILQFAFLSIIYAHPMPNTEIIVSLNDSSVQLEIKIPVPELLLAFSQNEQITAENLMTDSRGFIENYFREHLKILSNNGIEQTYEIKSLAMAKNTDEFVGEYQELDLKVEMPVREGFNPHDFVLKYDAVIHQVANHFALVKVISDSQEKTLEIGAIRYDFPLNKVPPLIVKIADKGKLHGFWNMVSTGMNRNLFLVFLLIISPLVGKWLFSWLIRKSKNF